MLSIGPVAPLAVLINLRTCSGASCGQSEFARSRHCFHRARDLRIAIIEDLYCGHRSIGSCRQIVTQLSFDEGSSALQLFRCHFEYRLASDETLKVCE